jgi:hypothetical protein
MVKLSVIGVMLPQIVGRHGAHRQPGIVDVVQVPEMVVGIDDAKAGHDGSSMEYHLRGG